MKKVGILFLVFAALSLSAGEGARIVDISPHKLSKRCKKGVTVTGEFWLKPPRPPAIYQFIYSDGVRSKKRILPIVRSHQLRVSSTRKFHRSFDGWVKLVVHTRSETVTSPPKPLKVRCKSPHRPETGPVPPRVLVSAVAIDTPEPARLNCPGSVHLSGTIQTREPVTVRYRFRTVDGEKSPTQTKQFRRSGSHRVTYDWPIRDRIDTRVRLEVLSPVKQHSSYVQLNASCHRQVTPPAQTRGPAVRDLQVDPIREATDYCPANVAVQGTFRHKGAIRVRYRFVRADGVTTPWEKRKFTSAGTFTPRYTFRVGETVQTKYRLEVGVRPLKQEMKRPWKKFHSPWKRFDVRCQDRGNDPVQTLRLEAASPSVPCPSVMNFQGGIILTRPAVVRYRFVRSDGYKSPLFTLRADRPGAYPVDYRWELPPALRQGWVQLRIVEPFPRRAYKTHFSRRNCPTVTPAGGGEHRSHGSHPRNPLQAILPIVASVIANTVNQSGTTAGTPPSNIPHPVTTHETGDPAVSQGPLPLPTPVNDADRDGIDDALEDRLLEAFSPYYLFNRGEKNLPSDPLYQIRHGRVLMANPLAAADSAFSNPIVVENCTGLTRDPGKILSCTQPPADLFRIRSAMTIALDLDDNFRSDPGNGRKKDWEYLQHNPAGLYGHVVPVENGRYKIEYWQFFPYSKTTDGDIEGDWKVLELWYNPATRMLESICHSVAGKKLCMDLTRSRPMALGDEFYEYRGSNYASSPAPISTASSERYPAAYQNNAVRFYRAPDGTMHPLVYLQRGSHDFWPTPSGSVAGERPKHTGNGAAYLNELNARRINLGELGHPRPDMGDPQGIVLRYAGSWGRNTFRTMRRSFGPPLQCDWQLAPGETSEWASRIRTGCGR